MRKHNAENELAKREYLAWLRNAGGRSTSTLDMVAAALHRFEAFNHYKGFKTFRREQAISLKAHLAEQINEATGKPLSKATLYSTLKVHPKRRFPAWLPGYGLMDPSRGGYTERIRSGAQGAGPGGIIACRRERGRQHISCVRLRYQHARIGDQKETFGHVPVCRRRHGTDIALVGAIAFFKRRARIIVRRAVRFCIPEGPEPACQAVLLACVGARRWNDVPTGISTQWGLEQNRRDTAAVGIAV